jgi:hypothetical protein
VGLVGYLVFLDADQDLLTFVIDLDLKYWITEINCKKFVYLLAIITGTGTGT